MTPAMIRVSLIVACGLFMEQLDGSIIATALPKIAQSLQTEPLHLNLAITSYMFSLAVFIPLSGWVADRLGARTVFKSAIIVFTLGSILCGLSFDLFSLVISRILQGIGGAMMVPVGRLILLRTVPKSGLVDAMAWVSAPALLGPVLGPPIGGLIVSAFSWRWIFFINVPIGIAGYILSALYIDNIRGRTREKLDIPGFLLVGASMAGMVFAFETVGRHLVPDWLVASMLGLGIVCMIGYLRHATRIELPIIDFKLLRYKTYRISIFGGSLFRIAIGALPFLMPLMLQYGFGMTPAASGFITLASAAGMVLLRIIATAVLRQFGFKRVLLVTAVINAIFMGGCALFTHMTPQSVIFIFLLIGGIFRSLEFTALNTIAYADMPEKYLSRANTLYNMLQQLMLSMGVAVGASFLNLTLYFRHETALSEPAFAPTFTTIGLFSIVSLLFFTKLSPQAGGDMSGHRVSGEEVERRGMS
ncbi:MAG: MFS transporter [Alphaproteobacteria bacterium]|nr:MFS transporter [Alphaproteobacteria bacterium]